MNHIELIERAAERNAAIETAALKAARLDAKTEGKLRDQANAFKAALDASASTVALVERLAPLRVFA
jgi:hypothetical protein